MSEVAQTAASPESPLLALAGAVALPGVDSGVAAHYGDFGREQRTLVDRVCVVDRSNRGVVRVTGDDRLGWLHSLTTQHVSELADRTGTEALILSPHGHIEHHLQLAELAATTWLDVEPGDAGGVHSFLWSMRFMLRVAVDDASVEFGQLTVAGPQVVDVLQTVGVDLLPNDWSVSQAPWGGFARRLPWPLPGTTDLVVPRESLPDVWHALTAAGAEPAGTWAWEALRVAARRPRLGFETDHRTIPHEIGWLPTAVHLQKGCYRGQETVARVNNLGRPPRRLVLLHLDGSTNDLPPHGAEVTTAGTPIGFVTTSARHYELGPIALALVKRNTPDDAALLAGDVSASIQLAD